MVSIVARANSLWVYSEAEKPTSIFPQKNGTERHFPLPSNREFALRIAVRESEAGKELAVVVAEIGIGQ